MKCYYHPEVDAVATCTGCGKAICQKCAVNVSGKLICQQCLSSGTVSKGQATESIPTNPLSVISLVLGILGLSVCVCGMWSGILLGAPAAITGWLARRQLLQAGQDQQGLQLATVGLVLGVAEVVLSILILVFVGAVYGLGFLSTLFQQ